MDYLPAITNGLWAGLACGVIPLIVGMFRGQIGSALFGLCACVCGGALAGIIGALPIAIALTLVIASRKDTPKKVAAQTGHAQMHPPIAAPPAELRFACPHCGRHLSALSDISGELIECPACTLTLRIPKALS